MCEECLLSDLIKHI